MNVLELPEQQQRAIAAREGMAFDAWRRDVEKSNAKCQKFQAEIIANEGNRPEGWTDADAARWQRKVDSGNP